MNDVKVDSDAAFLHQYNQEIDEANNDIEMGNYINHQEVIQLIKTKKNFNVMTGYLPIKMKA